MSSITPTTRSRPTLRQERLRGLFAFPNPVNETSARLVAGGVVLQTLLYLATGSLPVLAVLAYGFVARLATGPTLSPLGRLVTGWLTPRLEDRIGPGRQVPGPPKRFAQGIGATLSVAALVAHVADTGAVANVAAATIAAAATLESLAGFCLGCTVFGWLMRTGVVPDSVCQECADITGRLRARAIENSTRTSNASPTAA
jgi:hypothetical protein